jgi:hypothetical protein
VDEDCPLVRVTGGLPTWLDGSPDTRCIATKDSAVALADRNGNFHISADDGRTWSRQAQAIPHPSSVLIL